MSILIKASTRSLLLQTAIGSVCLLGVFAAFEFRAALYIYGAVLALLLINVGLGSRKAVALSERSIRLIYALGAAEYVWSDIAEWQLETIRQHPRMPPGPLSFKLKGDGDRIFVGGGIASGAKLQTLIDWFERKVGRGRTA